MARGGRGGPSKENQQSRVQKPAATLAIKNDKSNPKAKEKDAENNTFDSGPEEIWEVQLDDEYEDDDFYIHFDKQSLVGFIAHLEDDNLFKIDLVQDDEKAVEQRKRQSQARFKEMQSQIDDVHANIVDLQSTQESLKQKLKFLSGGQNLNQNKAVKKKGAKKQPEEINLAELSAEADRANSTADESQMQGASKRRKQTGMEILREADPDCT